MAKPEQILGTYKKAGGVRHLLTKFQNEGELEKGLEEYRTLTAPETETIVKNQKYGRFAKAKKTVESYLSGSYAKALKKKVGEDKEVPEHMKYGFAHLDEKEARTHAENLVRELAFSSMEDMYGKKAAEAARKEFESGNDKYIRDFIEKYIAPDSKEESSDQIMEELVRSIMQSDHLLDAFEDENHILRKVVKNYVARTDIYQEATQAYKVAIGSMANSSAKHHAKVKKAADKALDKFGYQSESHAGLDDLLAILQFAHKNKKLQDRQGNLHPYDPAQLHGNKVKKKPQEGQ